MSVTAESESLMMRVYMPTTRGASGSLACLLVSQTKVGLVAKVMFAVRVYVSPAEDWLTRTSMAVGVPSSEV